MADVVPPIIAFSADGSQTQEVMNYASASIQFTPSGDFDGTITFTASVDELTAPETLPLEDIGGNVSLSVTAAEMPTIRFVRLVGLRKLTITCAGRTTGSLDVVFDLTSNDLGGAPFDGAVTVADGADVALGATTDAAATTDTGTFSFIALFKRLLQKFTTQFPAALVGGRFDVNIGASSATVPVSGTVSVTEPVSVDDNGGSLTVDGTVASTVADGADVTLGTTADAAVTGDIAGTVSAKLRGLVKILASVWDSSLNLLKVRGDKTDGDAIGKILPVGGEVQSGGHAGQTFGIPIEVMASMQSGFAAAGSYLLPCVSLLDAGSFQGHIGSVGRPNDDVTFALTSWYAAALSLDAKYSPVAAQAIRQRQVEVYKSALATANGDTALWTPTTGKKFRLMQIGRAHV